MVYLPLFRNLFHSRQSACAFGRPTGRTKPSPTGPKVEYSYHTERRPFNERDVERHLAGEVSIVAIPLLEDGNSVWGAGDIDIYNGIPAYWSPVFQHVFTTKSGGDRPFVFFPRPRPASRVRDLLRHELTRLGFPNCEIFPKQDIASVGNGVNLPFFGERDAFENFVKTGFPAYYTVPVNEWPTPEARSSFTLDGDDDSGYWDNSALVALLDAYKENIPGFDFRPGRLGYMVPCPGNEEGWSDGAKHSFEDPKLSPFAEVFIQNGWPKFKCFHAHCDGGCGAPKKTINDFRSHYDPLWDIFDLDEWLWGECEKRGMTGGTRG